MHKKIVLFLFTLLTLFTALHTTAFASAAQAEKEFKEIFSLYDEFDYTETNWELMQKAYADGITAIRAASGNDAYTALNTAAEKLISIQARSNIITACISVENFVTEKGFIIAPQFIKVPKYRSVAEAFVKFAENLNKKVRTPYLFSGTIENNFELTGIYTGLPTTTEDETEIKTPDYLISRVGKYMQEPTDKTYLKAGDYTDESCFVFSVNNKFPNVKASAVPIIDEDVIRIHFSVYGKGADVGAGTYYSESPLFSPADKSELYMILAELSQKYDIEELTKDENNKKSYDNAMVVAQMANSAQKAVDKAIDKLEEITPPSKTEDIKEDTKSEIEESELTDTATDDTQDEIIEETNKNEFSDVTSDHYAFEAIDYFSDSDIINGRPDGSFGINDNVTRGEFATILARIEQSVSTRDLPFTDVKAADWFGAGVSFCYANGITNGKTLETFEPNMNITHQELATMIYRYSKFKGIALKTDSNADFLGNTIIEAYATEGVYALAKGGVILQDDGFEFEPTKNATRAECTKLLYNLIKTIAPV